MICITILTDFVTSHKIAFYSKLYDIDFLENLTHDRTYITHMCMNLYYVCTNIVFLDKKAPRTTLTYVRESQCQNKVCVTHLHRFLKWLAPGTETMADQFWISNHKVVPVKNIKGKKQSI